MTEEEGEIKGGEKEEGLQEVEERMIWKEEEERRRRGKWRGKEGDRKTGV